MLVCVLTLLVVGVIICTTSTKTFIMSALQKSIVKNKMPPRCPRTSGVSRLAGFSSSRRKDYTPVSWRQYFEKNVDVETEGGTFRVYMSKEPSNHTRPRIVTLHGGGYSGLSWALFTEEITDMIECQVISMDVRGHGETAAKDPDDLSADTLVRDVDQVLHKLFGTEMPCLILLGHSMGGAIAVRAAKLPSLVDHVEGLAVIDVVEGTAMEALASMQSFLRGRPTHFKSIEHAVEWCVRSGQVRNVDSAKVSMPSQIVNCETGLLAINEVDTYTPAGDMSEPAPHRHAPLADRIAEEDEDNPDAFPRPSALGDGTNANGSNATMKYKWRIDLSKTEYHWAGWFKGLSSEFLSVRAPKLLLLASIDALDKELMVGQMQGKFQMQVLQRCGHAVHEDTPNDVARAIAGFALRHRLTEPTENGQHMHLTPGMGC